jgi:hypothetical protein
MLAVEPELIQGRPQLPVHVLEIEPSSLAGWTLVFDEFPLQNALMTEQNLTRLALLGVLDYIVADDAEEVFLQFLPFYDGLCFMVGEHDFVFGVGGVIDFLKVSVVFELDAFHIT